MALALKKRDREATMAVAKTDHLTERLTLVEDEYHKAVEDHATVQVKQRMIASKVSGWVLCWARLVIVRPSSSNGMSPPR